ncbi:MAG: TIGR03862 family flavoprotein [Pseudohongiella sp.]|nr:TIGR03862 family flavoprotein [Pseudohongiella sp.]
MTEITQRLPAVIIGGGPAGLMAASTLLQSGIPVSVYDAMPSLGRKFLRAGVGGLNLTHSEPFSSFLHRYHPEDRPGEWIGEFGPESLVSWAAELGIDTFTGSSGRVFPVQKKASPLLRAWLQQLQSQGAQFFTRHRWLGWRADTGDDGISTQVHRFLTPDGEIEVQSIVTVLALGGGSWARLGSDGNWLTMLMLKGVKCEPFVASNCGFDVSWSAHVQENFAGAPLKSVLLRVQDGDCCLFSQRGEALVSRHGIQGGLVYGASRLIQQEIAQKGQATLNWDLLPDIPAETILQKLSSTRGKESRSNFLRKRLGLSGLKVALLYELMPAALDSPEQLTRAIKALPLVVTKARPLDEAISTAGGISLGEVDGHLMLKRFEGVFCAGEMLGWDAPTGGYLLTACFASGRRAGTGAATYLARQSQ